MLNTRNAALPERAIIKLGYMALSDCAPLVVASELGMFHDEGLAVSLSAEPSWSNIRDKVALGILDGAQMFASMPLAMSAGMRSNETPMSVPLVLNLNGNAITVSQPVYEALCDVAPQATSIGRAAGLRSLVERGRHIRLAHVFPESTCFYQLCDWLSAARIDPLRDVELTVVPATRMLDAIKTGLVDVVCVGEPWNTEIVLAGLGRTMITSAELWPNHAEKVLAITRDFAERFPNSVAALVRALLRAGLWLDTRGNRSHAARLLLEHGYLSVSSTAVEAALVGHRYTSSCGFKGEFPDLFVFGRYAAGFPWLDDTLWLIHRMQRFRRLPTNINARGMGRSMLAPEIYRNAARALGVPFPEVDERPASPYATGVNAEISTRAS